MADDLDAVIDAVAAIEDASGQATHIAAAAVVGRPVQVQAGHNTNVSLVGAGTTAPSRTLVSVPVLVSNSVPDGTMLVLDRYTILSVYGSVMLATSQEFYFDSDSIGVRATWRFGQKIANPDRVIKLTVASPGQLMISAPGCSSF